jgi:hypothetical protein
MQQLVECEPVVVSSDRRRLGVTVAVHDSDSRRTISEAGTPLIDRISFPTSDESPTYWRRMKGRLPLTKT